MDIVLNDLPFRYLMDNEYAVKESIETFVNILLELKKSRKDVQLIYDGDVNGLELMSNYSMSKLYNDRTIRIDQKRMIMKSFTHIKKIDSSNREGFVFDGDCSKLCGYALDENLLTVSFLTNKKFDVPILQGNCKKNQRNSSLNNIGNSLHIFIHSSLLGIRVYELNPKHKLGSNWGSPMDLDDQTAQEVLDSAIIYNNDEKCLINYYNGKFYVFRRHINNCYHGYIDAGVPENIRRKFCVE